MFRRFLESLEKCVLGRLAQHVHLVYDVHLVSADCRRVLYHLDDGPEVIDTVVGCRIELDAVYESALPDSFAVGTVSARDSSALAEISSRCSRFALHAVDCLGEYPRGTGLARTMGTGEQISLAHRTGPDLVLKDPYDVLLSYYVFEYFRPFRPV